MNNYSWIALGTLFVLWIGLTFYLIERHKTDEAVIGEYKMQIATLKADATALAARDKLAAVQANTTVEQAEAKGNKEMSEKIPSGCEDVRTWAIKQSQGM